MRNYKKSYKLKGHVVGHVTEAARSLQRLSEELRTHLCGVQSFFCLGFVGTGQHTGLPTYKFCNCAIMLVELELFFLHFMGVGAQTSRHTIQAQAQS